VIPRDDEEYGPPVIRNGKHGCLEKIRRSDKFPKIKPDNG